MNAADFDAQSALLAIDSGRGGDVLAERAESVAGMVQAGGLRALLQATPWPTTFALSLLGGAGHAAEQWPDTAGALSQLVGWLLGLSARDDHVGAAIRYAAVTKSLAEEGHELARSGASRGELEGQVHRLCSKLLEHVLSLLGEQGEVGAGPGQMPTFGEGVPLLDEALARTAERTGASGREFAKAIRAKAARRVASVREGQAPLSDLYRLWLPAEPDAPFPVFLKGLARCAWHDVVRAQLLKPAALVLPVHEEVTRVHSRSFRTEERDGQLRLSFDGDHAVQILPSVEFKTIDGLLARGLDLLGSVTGHRVLRWEVTEGHTRALRQEPDPRRLEIDGGWTSLAHTLGLPEQERDSVRAVVVAQAHCYFNLPHGMGGNLLTYQESRAVGRRRRLVTIVLGDALLPSYVFAVREALGNASQTARDARRLVPLTGLPPFIGRRNEHGQQATLSMLVTRELRLYAHQFATSGGVSIPLERWAELAAQARVRPAILGQLIDRWTNDGDDGAAFLTRVEAERFRLGEAYAPAHAFLLEAGQREAMGSELGRKSVRSRQARTRRQRRGAE